MKNWTAPVLDELNIDQTAGGSKSEHYEGEPIGNSGKVRGIDTDWLDLTQPQEQPGTPDDKNDDITDGLS